MTAVTQQSMWDVIKDYSESKKQLVMNFAITLNKPATEDEVIDIADQAAESTDIRLSHDEVFGDIRRAINAVR